MGPRKLFDGLFLAGVIVSLLSLGLAQPPSDPPAKASSPSPSPSLERVIGQMDAAATSFRTTEATVLWDQYQKVVDEHEAQKGKVYFRRAGNEIQMAADITEPDQKYVLFNGSKVQVYQPKIEQVTAYSTGKNAKHSSFLVWASAARADMLKSFR
jgi:outer membrane lipoprotein-sorting protein